MGFFTQQSPNRRVLLANQAAIEYVWINWRMVTTTQDSTKFARKVHLRPDKRSSPLQAHTKEETLTPSPEVNSILILWRIQKARSINKKAFLVSLSLSLHSEHQIPPTPPLQTHCWQHTGGKLQKKKRAFDSFLFQALKFAKGFKTFNAPKALWNWKSFQIQSLKTALLPCSACC